jgi:hypothetical protein
MYTLQASGITQRNNNNNNNNLYFLTTFDAARTKEMLFFCSLQSDGEFRPTFCPQNGR